MAPLDEYGRRTQRCLVGGDRAKLHDVGCHVIRQAGCAAGLKSQREKRSSRCSRRRSSRNHGLT